MLTLEEARMIQKKAEARSLESHMRSFLEVRREAELLEKHMRRFLEKCRQKEGWRRYWKEWREWVIKMRIINYALSLPSPRYKPRHILSYVERYRRRCRKVVA